MRAVLAGTVYAVPKPAVNRPAARLSGPIVLLTNQLQPLPAGDRLIAARSTRRMPALVAQIT